VYAVSYYEISFFFVTLFLVTDCSIGFTAAVGRLADLHTEQFVCNNLVSFSLNISFRPVF